MGLVAKWDQDKIQAKKAASLHSETALNENNNKLKN